MEDATQRTINTLRSYKLLAADPQKKAILLKDGTSLQFLAYVLDSRNEVVVSESLETIRLLAQRSEDHPFLLSTFGVLEALESLLQKSTNFSDRTMSLAGVLCRVLQKSKSDTSVCSIPSASSSVLRETRHKRYTALEGTQVTRHVRTKAHVISLHIHGLHAKTQKLLEETLISVRGVVSLVVDVEHQRCMVRASQDVDLEKLASAVSSTGIMEAKLVARNKWNQEILQPIVPETLVLKNCTLPEYFPEEDSPVRDKALINLRNLSENATGWFSVATKFLQKSFYW